MSLIPSTSADSKTKSFWERPEGTAGMLTLGALGLGGFFLVSAILPALLAFLGMAISAVGQTIVLGLLCAVLAGFLYVVTNRKFLTLVGYMFKSVMRKATGVFVEIDPIGIMKNYIDDMKDWLKNLLDRKTKLSGQIRVLKEQIAKNDRDRDNALSTAKVAREQGKGNVFTLNAKNAGRLQSSNMTLQDMLKKMELLYRALEKYAEASDTVIQDMESEVKVRSQERDMILAGSSAMRSAAAIMRGDSDKKELFDQAMEFVVQDYGQKMGEIEDFMSSSKSFIDGLDLQNGVYEEQALVELEKWEHKADSILLGDDKRLMLENQQTAPFITLDTSSKVGVSGAPEYDKFFR